MIRFIGVRHHSPACARLVRHAVRELRPAFVLIEGPADVNERLGELLLGHELPIALFTYSREADRTHASWSPFCAYSPEWVALEEGRAVGSDVRFIDLPAWHGAFAGVANRYSDGQRRSSLAIKRLCARLGVDGMDALWDHLFEQPMAPEVLEARLAEYFDGLRGDERGGERDEPREAFMARAIAWAAREAGERHVVVVTGGYHKPALEKLVPTSDASAFPEIDATPEGVRRGSFLVPYSFKRLDSFVGYESGMPSPAYYQSVWDDGPDVAAETMMRAAVERMRGRDVRVSAADLIAARTLSEGLARMRGHACLARSDLLDGVAGALVKDALDEPLPWTERGRLRPGTDALLVEVVVAFSGEKRGKLHPETPRPPLVASARADLEEHDIVPRDKPRTVAFTLTEDAGLAKSRVLHRLIVLGIPGVKRIAGPTWGTDPVLDERWEIVEVFEQDSAFVEAGAYGPTLESAAAACLEEKLVAGGGIDLLMDVLAAATFVGVASLSSRILGELGPKIRAEGDLGKLGKALARLVALYRHDTLLGSAKSDAIGVVVEAAFDQALWLVEGVTGGPAPAEQGIIDAVAGVRDALRYAGTALSLPVARAHGVMERKAVDGAAPPALRGAALGFLWSVGAFPDAATAEAHALEAFGKASLPTQLGDWLAGLFALAREEVLSAEDTEMGAPEARRSILRVLDERLGDMRWDDYLVALPAMRLAFSFFPPLEKERIAARVLVLRGKAPGSAKQLLKLPVSAGALAGAMELDVRVDALEKAHGLAPRAPAPEVAS